MRPSYIPLRVHSAYSLLESSLHPKDIVRLCKAAAVPAVAVTDRNNMFGAMEFCDEAKAGGVQPILGLLLGVLRPHSAQGLHKSKPLQDWLVLLAKDAEGYANLTHLLSKAHMSAPGPDAPAIGLDDIADISAGLIALTAGPEGAVWRLLAAGQRDAAAEYLARLKQIFPGRLYVELQRIGGAEEAAVDSALIDLAYVQDLPLVATNPVLFDGPSQASALDALHCIAGGRYLDDAKREHVSPELWFKPPDAMAALFADVPEAIENTLVIAQRCAVLAPSRKPILPNFAPGESEADMLLLEAQAGLEERLEAHVFAAADDAQTRDAKAKPYRDRLVYEADVIAQMGFPGYFLIVSDFIRWAKEHGIPVGPGRGSGAGSLVAWALQITDLDPLRFGLLFERFLNPERVSMPDFDIDFCETRRDEVIQYVQEKYGRDQVAQIITFGKLKARAVVKDVGRVMQLPYGQVDRLSKLIPNNPANPLTLSEAIQQEPRLAEERDRYPAVKRLIETALQLEGLYRHASTHAAGIVIGDRPLDQLVPLYRDPKSDMAVTQFDMKWVEKAGLVKFDFLGLKTLSVLQMAVELLAKRGIQIDLLKLPFDDGATFQLLARGDTVGVFQLEGEGMRRTLAGLRPDKFEDIIALVALYRPGPMDNIPTYNNRKHGVEKVESLHPLLDAVLEETYGVIIYQEQVMQIAQILAGYSLGEADLLRRAMGKKKKEEMDAQKARFVEGARAKGVDERQADYIFELVAKFAGYGFNKSHAAAYALVAYQTAYLKANYPVEFFAASMTYDLTNTDKLAVFVEDAKRSGVRVLPPDVNSSDAVFSVEPDAASQHGFAVRYALAALKGVGERAMEIIAEQRAHAGAFASITAFADRLDTTQLNRRALESLASGGALDNLVANRAAAFAMAESLLSRGKAANDPAAHAQVSLFGDMAGQQELPVPTVAPWPMEKIIEAEKEAFGFYFSAHPMDRFAHVLRSNRVIGSVEAFAMRRQGEGRKSVVLAGIAQECFTRKLQDGTPYAVLGLSDTGGVFRVRVYDRALLDQAHKAAQSGEALLVQAELSWRLDEDTPRATARALTPLEALAATAKANLDVFVREAGALPVLSGLLASLVGGRGEVRLTLMVGFNRDVEMKLPGSYKVDPNLRSAIAAVPGVVQATLVSSS
jgi:DNA polymerase III subunit alpha